MGFKIIIYLTIVLAVIASLIVIFSWIFARWWCKPKREPIQKTPDNYGLQGEPVQFHSHGIFLKGWFVPGKSGSQPWPVILMMHGWSRTAAELMPLASLLHSAGFAVLLFDARGHGQSGEDGPITICKFAQDILAGMDYLADRPDVDRRRLGVFGRSIGGSSAILAAAQDTRIRVLVSCSAFADPRPLTRDTLRLLHFPTWPFTGLVCFFIEHWLGTAMKNVAPVNQIGKIRAPLLLIHGESDRYIKPDNLALLYAHAPQEFVEKILVPGRGHADTLRDNNVRQQIAAFFRKALDG